MSETSNQPYQITSPSKNPQPTYFSHRHLIHNHSSNHNHHLVNSKNKQKSQQNREEFQLELQEIVKLTNARLSAAISHYLY